MSQLLHVPQLTHSSMHVVGISVYEQYYTLCNVLYIVVAGPVSVALETI